MSSTSPTTVYLALSFEDRQIRMGSVSTSRDGGTSWKTIFSGADVHAIAVDPIRQDVLYAGTSPCGCSPVVDGVYQLSSTGRSSPLGRAGAFSSRISPWRQTARSCTPSPMASLQSFVCRQVPRRRPSLSVRRSGRASSPRELSPLRGLLIRRRHDEHQDDVGEDAPEGTQYRCIKT